MTSGLGCSSRRDFFFFFDSHIFIPVSGIIYNPVERAYPTLRALRTNAGLPIPGHMNAQGCRGEIDGRRLSTPRRGLLNRYCEYRNRPCGS